MKTKWLYSLPFYLICASCPCLCRGEELLMHIRRSCPSVLCASVSTNYIVVHAAEGDTFSKIARETGCEIKALMHENPLTRPTSIQIGQPLIVPKICVNLNGWLSFTNLNDVTKGCTLYTYVACNLTSPENVPKTKNRYAAFVRAVKQKTVAIDRIKPNVLDDVNLFCIPSLNTDHGYEPNEITNLPPVFDFDTARSISTALLPTIPKSFRENLGQHEGPFLLTVSKPLVLNQRGEIEITRPVLLADISVLKESTFRQLVVDYQSQLKRGINGDQISEFEFLKVKAANLLVSSGDIAIELLDRLITLIKSSNESK